MATIFSSPHSDDSSSSDSSLVPSPLLLLFFVAFVVKPLVFLQNYDRIPPHESGR